MTRVDPLIAAMRDRRHQRGVKPYVLAELAGVWPQGVYDGEAGRRDLRLSTIRRLADALGCDIALVPRASDLPPAAKRGTQPEREAAA